MEAEGLEVQGHSEVNSEAGLGYMNSPPPTPLLKKACCLGGNHSYIQYFKHSTIEQAFFRTLNLQNTPINYAQSPLKSPNQTTFLSL